jgi:hypothetical protein
MRIGARVYKTRATATSKSPDQLRRDGELPLFLLCFLVLCPARRCLRHPRRRGEEGARHSTPVAREPEYPLHLAKREATGRKTRHLRPVYENTKRDITLPDVGQIATFPPTGIPQPIRGPLGDIRSGGTNEEIDRQNPDYVAPPPATMVCLSLCSSRLGFSSDLIGIIPNLKWSFSLSHTRLLNGGWIREQTVTDLPPCVFPSIEEL